MEKRIQQLSAIYAMIIQAEKRAIERYNHAAGLFKEGHPFEARIVLYSQHITTLALMRLKSYLKNKLNKIANEL